MQLKPGSTLQNGKYEIIRSLGQGGFGITYLARHTVMDRQVCIKEFFVKEYCDRNEETSQVSLGSRGNAEMMRRYMDKFIKEAKTVAKLDHSRIVKIFDTFYENNTAYSVMDYINGCSLAEWVKKNGPLPEAQAVNYIRQVGAALGYAHAQRVMHLDVKPSNIMLSEGGKKATLIDFGMAKQYTETGEQTSSTPVGVSHGYAPLEQYQEGGVQDFSPSTDIYSLGATLYFALTGKRPPQATVVAMQGGLKTVEGDFSPSVKQTILKAMRFKKEERPGSVDEFLLLLNTPVLQPRPAQPKSVQPKSVQPRPATPVVPVHPPKPASSDATIVIPSGRPAGLAQQTRVAGSAPQPHPAPGVSRPSGSSESLPTIVKVALIIGLAIGLVPIVICSSLLISGLDYAINYDTSSDAPITLFLCLLAILASIAGEVGVILMLLKKRIGYWMLVAGGVACSIFVALLGEGWGFFFSCLMIMVIISLATFGILQVKGKNTVSAWEMLK